MAGAEPTHFLLVSFPSWAHTRSLIGLAVSLLSSNPKLHITFLIPDSRAHAAVLEFAQYPSVDRSDRLVRVNYGDEVQGESGGMWNPPGWNLRETCEEKLASLVDPIAKLGPVVDGVTGERVALPQIPYSAIIPDVVLGTFGKNVKTKTESLHPGRAPAPLIAFVPINTPFTVFAWTEDHVFYSRLQRIMEENGDDEAAQKRICDELIVNNEDIVNLPGLWPFHMFESNPIQDQISLPYLMAVFVTAKIMRTQYDGLAIGWPKILGEKLQGVSEKNFGTIYQVGPQLPPTVKDEWTAESKKGDCKAYLDASPPKSVLYISFGSAIYGPTAPQMKILLDVLDELGIRFIMAEGVAPEEIRKTLQERVGKGSSKGLLAAWAPQRAILSHPSTAMFLSQGGSNSAMEGIFFQVPMVIWPASIDQPSIANELDYLGVAKELIQVRGDTNIGRRIARDNRLVVGTKEAMRQEMIGLFGDM